MGSNVVEREDVCHSCGLWARVLVSEAGRICHACDHERQDREAYRAHNARQAQAERAASDALMRTARSAKASGKAFIASDCVASARSARRWARDLARGAAS